jgi:hypothetical protein
MQCSGTSLQRTLWELEVRFCSVSIYNIRNTHLYIYTSTQAAVHAVAYTHHNIIISLHCMHIQMATQCNHNSWMDKCTSSVDVNSVGSCTVDICWGVQGGQHPWQLGPQHPVRRQQTDKCVGRGQFSSCTYITYHSMKTTPIDMSRQMCWNDNIQVFSASVCGPNSKWLITHITTWLWHGQTMVQWDLPYPHLRYPAPSPSVVVFIGTNLQ